MSSINRCMLLAIFIVVSSSGYTDGAGNNDSTRNPQSEASTSHQPSAESPAVDIKKLKEQFDAFLERYHVWSEPSRKYAAENFRRINKESYTWKDYRSGLKELQGKMRAAYDPFLELSLLLDDLCPTYLATDAVTREQVRQVIVERRGLSDLVRGYANHVSQKINTPEDAQWLRYSLAAISMENAGTDVRDMLFSLADLYVRAEEAGMNPQPHFDSVAKLSATDKPRGGSTSMAETLRNFSSYRILTERRAKGQPD